MLTNIEAMRLNFMLKNDNKVLEIPIIKIRPNKAQPRKTFDETELAALSASISENGILQPLSVRKISAAEYELVAGERRLPQGIGFGRITKGAVHRFKVFGKRVSHLCSP